MPRQHRARVGASALVRHETVTPEQIVRLFPACHRQGEGAVAIRRRVPHPRVVLGHCRPVPPPRFFRRTPRALGQSGGRAFRHGGPFVVTDAPVREARRVNVPQLRRAARTAVGQKIAGPILPKLAVLPQPGRQGRADIPGRTQFPGQQERTEPERLPGQGEIAVIVELRPLKGGTEHFDLRVIKEDLGPTGVGPAGGVGPRDHPPNELGDEFPDRGDGFVTLRPQPLAQLGLVGELVHAGQLADQRLVVEPLGVGQTRAAGAETVEDLGHDQFGAVAVGRAGARVQAGQAADLVPEIKLLGQRFEGWQPAQSGLPPGRDKLEAKFR
ncbi:MAG: hypothetical protein BWX84_00873 [Verrucomicrobia bacterium ADurb.Bin118]|nr:MAG: hypothetical protein BWX84_00873 [Verrucomicrobia bacterium ADurb.Bin118]